MVRTGYHNNPQKAIRLTKKSKDDTIYADYLSAVERGDMETARRMVEAAAKAMKRIAEGVRQFIKGIIKDGKVKGAHNAQTQPFMDDVKAPEQMAKLMSENAEARQKNNTSGEVRYSKGEVKFIDRGYRSYQNIDLNTLDDEEIKVYNNRGWAYDLFTDEDIVLLSEKIDELDLSIKNNVSPRLYTNSIIVEFNNKLVVLSGNYKIPEIHSVFVINSSSETLAEWIKEEIIDEGGAYANNREQFEEFGRTYQSIAGIQSVGFFSSYDYSYIKGRSDTGQRAIYNIKADYYGYTKQFQDRTGDNSEAQRRKTDVKNRDTRYSKDDTIYDYITNEYGDAKSAEDKCLRL